MLIREYGWGFDRCEEWILSSLKSMLLPAGPGRGGF
jgi:hypothetical protein